MLVAKETGDTRASNPHCYDFRKMYQKLYYQFKPDCYFWILIVILRKFGLSFTGLMFRKNAGFQVRSARRVLYFFLHGYYPLCAMGIWLASGSSSLSCCFK